MKVNGRHYRSIWFDAETGSVRIIDQRWLPHDFRIATLKSLEEFATAIHEMWVRGAPLIGATAAYGMAEQMDRDPSDASIQTAYDVLHDTRPDGDQPSLGARPVAARRWSRCHRRNAARRPGRWPMRSPRKTWRSTAGSAPTALRS